MVLASRRQGPWWDDWYYPEKYNEQLNNLRKGIWNSQILFGDGYGLGGYTFLNLSSKLFTLDFSLGASDSFEKLLDIRISLIFLAVSGVIVLKRIAVHLGFSDLEAQFASLLLAITPAWLGQATVNIKDSVVAVGILFIVDGLLSLFKYENREFCIKYVIAILELILGIYISFGTRFGLYLFIFLAELILIFGLGNYKERRINLILLVGANVVSYILLMPMNPVLLRPFSLVVNSVTGTLSLFNQSAGPVLTNGMLLDGNNPPWWYLPSWVLSQMPATFFIVLLFGVAHFLLHQKMYINKLSKALIEEREQIRALTIKWLVVIWLMAGPPVVAMILRPPLYDGDRQFLMLYPLLALLLAKCFTSLLNFNLTKVKCLVVASLVLAPGVALLQIHPFPYVYKSEFIFSPNTKWEGDYMGVSLKEAVRRIPSNATLAFDFSDERWLVIENMENTFSETVKVSEKPILVVTRRGARTSVPNGCRKIDEVSVRPWGREVILSFIALCEREDVSEE
jgi:hypothetical protein